MSDPAERSALFDELMAEELRRQPVNGWAIATLVFGLLGGLLAPIFAFVALVQIKDHRHRGRALVGIGLAAFACWVAVLVFLISTGRAWWQRHDDEPVSGLDLEVGDCFTAPPRSGEYSVPRIPCTTPHSGEVFAVIPLADGPYPDVVELYDDALARCQTQAGTTGSSDMVVQVMTPTSRTWQQKPHQVVCYYRFASDRLTPR